MSTEEADGELELPVGGPRAGAMQALARAIAHVRSIEGDLIVRERRARATKQDRLALALLAQQRVARDVLAYLRSEASRWKESRLRGRG